MGPASQTSIDDLPPDDRIHLDHAYRALRDAALTFEQCADRDEQCADGDVVATAPGSSATPSALRRLQQAVDDAEDRYWRVREELFGQRRPVWAPRASLVAAWFSDEDALYDDLPDAPIS
jgi:hypothetical protein